jgi:branched-chain amino acid transport system permease protein
MEMIWQGVFNGLMMGGIYVLVALGLTIIFSIMGIVQFAHGEIYILGTYCVYDVWSLVQVIEKAQSRQYKT